MSCLNPGGIEVHWPLSDAEVFAANGRGHFTLRCLGCDETERVDFQMPPQGSEEWESIREHGDPGIQAERAAFQAVHYNCT